MDWTEGYYADLEYTSGYYHELGPAHLRFVCAAAGVRCAIPEAPTYLELGFGRGVSINLHAAGSEGEFWGADFNPAHVAHGRELASATGAKVRLSEDSFAELARRQDLPDFDVIALHGVWSWVSEANRAVIVDLIRRKLRPGGVVYLSYNCLPGWAPRGPVRHLLNLGRAYDGPGRDGPRGEVERALGFLQEVVGAQPKFFADVPVAAKHAAGLAKQSRRYLAHEYFNADWHVPYFSEVAGALAEAKLTYVGSARILDRVNDIHLHPEGVALLDRLKEPVLRESVRDFLVDQRFRPDVFVKGAAPLSLQEQTAHYDAQAFVLTCPLDEIDFRITGALGQATLPEAVYRPLCETLAAEAFRPKTGAALIAATGLKQTDLVAALTVLVGMGVLRPARRSGATARAQCDAYNRLVLDRVTGGVQLKHMAAPVTEGGVLTSRSTQLFLRAWLNGARTPDAFALDTWEVFQRTNERAVKNDQEVVSREDNLAVLGAMAERFLEEVLPLYRALEILPPATPAQPSASSDRTARTARRR